MKKSPQKYRKVHKRNDNATQETIFIKSILGTLLLTLAVGGGALLISSLILTFTSDPLALSLPAGLVCAALTAFMGGFFATRLYHVPTLGAGLIVGILLTALSLLFSLLFAKSADCYTTGYSVAVSALLHAGLVGLSIGGAFVGAREQMPSKKKRRKRR